MSERPARAEGYTAKGAATRARIVETSARLFYANGVRDTSNDDIRRAAGISGSQLNHYFPSRRELLRAVLDYRVVNAVDSEWIPGSGRRPATMEGLRQWAAHYVDHYEELLQGCRVGSLAAEALKSEYALEIEVADGFERWRQALQDSLNAVQRNGEIAATADTRYLSWVLLGAVQGGMLLIQSTRTVEPLRAALHAALTVAEACEGSGLAASQ